MVAVTGSSTGAGLAAAAVAAACYETGYAFQALEARGVGPRHALRASLLGQLVRNRRWLGATALSLLGWPLQVLALALAPLALVQPALALGLLLLLVLGGARRLATGVDAHRRAVARISVAALGIRVSERSGSGRWSRARRSAASSSARVLATSASPKRR